MANQQPRHFKTISEYHQAVGLPKPEHPLISVVRFDDYNKRHHQQAVSWVFDFYTIALKRDFAGKIKYGQQQYDFDEGILTFMAPGQVLKIEMDEGTIPNHSGWLLLFHPDFLWNTHLAKQVKAYGFFDYSVHEALFLSEKEERIIADIMQGIQQEYQTNIDGFTQNIIVARLEVLLNYAERFYQRQFITRKVPHTQLLEKLEHLVNEWMSNNALTGERPPSVKQIANSLNVSPNYLSALLKSLTGKSTQQHIQDMLIEKAKQQLSATALSISEVAYGLGFSHPQSFSKLFKTKTSMSPLEFREAFN